MTRLVAVSHTGLASGAEKVLVRVLVAAREAGWDVACCSPAGPLTDQLAARGVTTYVLPALTLSAAPTPLAALGLLARSARAGRRVKRACARANLVLVNGLLALPAVRLARLETPVVWMVHDVVRRPAWIRIVQACRPAVSRALCVSEAAAGPVRRLGLDVSVVPQGTPWPVEPGRQPTGPPVVGCVGLLTPWKGQDVLLEAMAGSSRRDAVVEIVGGTFPKDAAYAARLRERAERDDLRGRVRFTGPVEDVVDRMRDWTLLVSPSIEPETGPLVLFEAMSVGLPVVATAHGGPLEFVGGAGQLVPPGDPVALRDALDSLLADDARRSSMAQSGRQQVSEQLSLPTCLDRVLAVLADVRDAPMSVAGQPAAAAEQAEVDVRLGIVSYNTGALLERCLRALPAALGGLRAEVVVVDNASCDDSVAVARSHPNVSVLASPDNVGYAKAMNLALQGSRAPILIALNPDTEPEPGSLATLVATLREHPEAGCVVPVLRNEDGSLQHSVHRFPSTATALVMGLVPGPLRRGPIGRRWWLEGYAMHDRAQPIDWAIGAVHCLRTAALPGPGPYSERWFMYAEDMELCWRLRQSGWHTLLAPAAQVLHVGNAAGAVEFGAARQERWLEATYGWYVEARGAAAARRWARSQVLGLTAKGLLLRLAGPGRGEHARGVAELRRYHLARSRASR